MLPHIPPLIHQYHTADGYRAETLHPHPDKEFYPEYHHLGFLPLAGTELPREQERETAGQDNYMACESVRDERYMNVIMTGNYTPPSFCEKHIQYFY